MKQATTEAINRLRDRIHLVIEGTDTPLGKLFDVVLIVAIIASVMVVIMDSVASYHQLFGHLFIVAEWVFTILFTIEYAARLFSSPNRLRYATSFFGIVDLLSILPTYLSLFLVGWQYLLVVRILRVLRIFRVLKLMAYMQQAGFLLTALKASRQKIIVFFMSIIMLVTVFGAIMYVIEGPENGFTSIPIGIYWAVVTLTTVGYGDISPLTPLGRVIATLIMITGYSIIAVPTGIFTAELAKKGRPQLHAVSCPKCGKFGHATGANYCDRCGGEMHL